MSEEIVMNTKLNNCHVKDKRNGEFHADGEY